MNDLVYKIGDCVKTTGFYYSNMLGVITGSTEFYRVQMIYNLNSNESCDFTVPFCNDEIKLATKEECYIINKLRIFK